MIGRLPLLKTTLNVTAISMLAVIVFFVTCDEAGLELTNTLAKQAIDPVRRTVPVIFRKEDGYHFPFIGNLIIHFYYFLRGEKPLPSSHINCDAVI